MRTITPEPARTKTTTMYWGERMYDTLISFDTFCRRKKLSRTQGVDYLLNYFNESERRRMQPIIL